MSTPDDAQPRPHVASFIPELVKAPVAEAVLSAVTPPGGSLNIFADASRERESTGSAALGCFALDDRYAIDFERALVEEKARLGLAGREIKFAKRKSIRPDRLDSFMQCALSFPSVLVVWVRRLDDAHGHRMRTAAAKYAGERKRNALFIAALYVDGFLGTAMLLSNRQQSMSLWPDRNSFPDHDDDLVRFSTGYLGLALPTVATRLPAGLSLPSSRSISRAQGNDSLQELGRSVSDLAAGISAQYYSGGAQEGDHAAAAIHSALRRTSTVDDPPSAKPGTIHVGYRIASVPDGSGQESLKRFFFRPAGGMDSAST